MVSFYTSIFLVNHIHSIVFLDDFCSNIFMTNQWPSQYFLNTRQFPTETFSSSGRLWAIGSQLGHIISSLVSRIFSN